MSKWNGEKLRKIFLAVNVEVSNKKKSDKVRIFKRMNLNSSKYHLTLGMDHF
jgi:hypothetical protein